MLQGRETVRGYKDIHAPHEDVGNSSAIFSEELVKHHHIQLFNLEQDPWETTNLADLPEHADRIRSLAADMKTWQTETDDFMKDTPILLQ